MATLFQVLLDVILPIFILLGLGGFLHKKFHFNMNTLSKILTYFLLPAIAFVNIYRSNISLTLAFEIISFLLLQSAILIVTCELIARRCKFDRGMSGTFKNTIVLINSGNYGLPISQLVFQQNPIGLSIQVIVMIFQNLLTYTYGLYNSVSTKGNNLKAIGELFKIPIIYCLILGLVLNYFKIEIPPFIWNPVNNIANAFLAIALLTLGAQIAFLKLSYISFPLILSLIGRLVLAPIIGLMIIFVLGIEGTTAQALFIATSFPSSRNSALFALEYNNHPDYAAQAVFLSTLLSSITVTIVIIVSDYLF